MSAVRTSTVCLVVALLLAGCGQQTETESREMVAAPELIPRAEIFGNPDKALVRISPDGSKISYVAAVDGVLNVWVGPADDPSAARAVTHDTYRGIRRYNWAQTNNHIVYLQDKGGDENWRAHSVDLTSGEEKDLTPMEGIRAEIMRISHLHPEEILVGINDRDERLHDVYRIDLTSGERTLVEENPGYAEYLADDHYNVRFAFDMTDDGGMDCLRKKSDGGYEPFMSIGMEDMLTTQPFEFDKSGERLFMIDSRERNTAALYALDIASGEKTLLYENPLADVSDGLMHPTEKTFEAVASTYERKKWHVLDESVAADFEYLETVADGELEIVDSSLDHSQWIVGYEQSEAPFSYYHYDRDKKEAKFLFSNRGQLDKRTLAPMYPEVLDSRDGLKLVNYLTLPVESDPDADGRPAGPLPTVLFVHGGPWSRDSWGYHSYHQWLANRGYAVLSVNYRGSTGFGKDFINASTFEWAGKMHDDLIDAVNWAVEQGISDPQRIAIMGGSYGGYATLVGVTFTPETFACGVDIVGPSNLITLLESFPAYWQPTIELWSSRVGDHRTEEGRALLTERSPLTRVADIQRPLLIGQGANDPRVTQIESDQIVDAMQAKNIPVTYVLYPDEGHGFARPENRTSFNAVAEAFLSECLGGRVEPIGNDFEGSTIEVPAGREGVPGLSEALAGMEAEGEEEAEEKEAA